MKRLFFIIVSLCCVLSCADLKQAQSDIADLQGRVDSIETQLAALQSAFDNLKHISDVKPFADDIHTGWEIIFTDNTSILIYDGNHGKDAVTPILNINPEGYWEVSYDNGISFTLVLGADGQPVHSQGKEGLSLRVTVNGEGQFVLESYFESDPDLIVESIVTPYTSSPDACIASIVKDPVSETIRLMMADGTEYLFNLDVLFPTGIVVLAESLVLPKNGSTGFMFRVNPSNAVVNLSLESESPMFELDMAIEQMTRSYVTSSSNYILEKIEYTYDADGNVKEGQYRAIVKDMGVSMDYCEGASLVLNTKDGKGTPIQVSSDLFKIKSPDKPQFTSFSINNSYAVNLEETFINVQLPYGTDVTALRPNFDVSEGKVFVNQTELASLTPVDFSSPVEFTIVTDKGQTQTYIVTISYSSLPVVYINTKNAAPVTSKENWLKETEIYITNAGKYNVQYSESQIRGRGNTTWNYPKKPFAIKLDSKESVMGMPKHKRWVLLANYVDKTCIRNSVAFEIARRSEGLDWTPRGYHVDVVLNGVFMGNYFLCEQIKGDKNRVNITEMESTDIDEYSITGGYLLEVDKNFDEVNKFYSPVRNMPFMVKEPDEETLVTEQYNWLYNHISEVETALYGEGSTTEGYLQYIDLDSFIDYWFVYELTGTGEPTHPKSVFMWKERGEKIHAGPVWDFDYFTFQPYYNTMLINTNAVWNDRIINDPANRAVIKERWMAARDKYRTIAEEIDRQYWVVKESAEYNETLWPLTLNVNRDDAMSVTDAVERMKTYYQTKFSYMDEYISNF